MDGGMYTSSISDFCKTPVGGKTIKGLAQKMISGDHSSELNQLQTQNLIELLDSLNLKGINLGKTYDTSLTPLN